MADSPEVALLPLRGLAGVSIGVSVSGSADLGRLGLDESHLRIALAEIARTVLVAGGSLYYGGNLSESGYATYLVHEVQRYARRDAPFVNVLALSEHRKSTQEELHQRRMLMGLSGRLVCLDESGEEVHFGRHRREDVAPHTALDHESTTRSLTALRKWMTDHVDARVVIGGKREGYSGRYPGIVEETLLAVRAGQPVFLAGGFGGAAANIASRLGLVTRPWPYLSSTEADPGFVVGLEQLQGAFADGGSKLRNGLTTAENERLAVTHRPSEVATLVAIGMTRLRGSDGQTTK